MPVGPLGERPELEDRGVGGLNGIADWEEGGVEDANVAAETVENAGGLEGHELAIRPANPVIREFSSLNFCSQTYRFRKLPYRTKTFNLEPVFAKLNSAMLIAVSSSNCEIQSPDSKSEERRKGRYLSRISGSSSASEIASWWHCASDRSGREPIQLRVLLKDCWVRKDASGRWSSHGGRGDYF